MLKKLLNSIFLPQRIAFSSLVIVGIVAFSTFICLIEQPALKVLNSTTTLIGETSGKAVGLASGSIEALDNAPETIEVALENASNGEVKQVSIEESVHGISRLELLSTDVKVHYTWEYGDRASYAALYLLNGKGVFVTDLSTAEVSVKDKVVVELNMPALEVYFEDTPQLIREYKASFYQPLADMETANYGYLNQRSEAIKMVKEKMMGYEGLLKKAKESGEKTIKNIVNDVYGMEAEVIWKKGEGVVCEGKCE